MADGRTYNKSNLTFGVLVTTGHHGSHCVIYYCHKVQVKLLNTETRDQFTSFKLKTNILIFTTTIEK